MPKQLINYDEGKGTFSMFEDPLTRAIIEQTNDEKTIVNVSRTSKAMHHLCQNVGYLFTKPQSYTISIAQLRYFQKTFQEKKFFKLPCGKEFILSNMQKGEDFLHYIHNDATVVFNYNTGKELAYYSGAVPVVLGDSPQVKDIYTEEYRKMIEIAQANGAFVDNVFLIGQRPESPK